MAVHPKYPLAAVRTQSGRLIFIDLTEENSPKVIENCRMHKKKIQHIKYIKFTISKYLKKYFNLYFSDLIQVELYYSQLEKITNYSSLMLD